jgi:hypothetical protein
VTQISDTSKLIKEKMDIEIREIIHCFELKADFFITSRSLKKVWSTCFSPEQFRAPVDLFIQGFENIIGQDILSSKTDERLDRDRKETLKTVLSVSPDSYNNNEPSISLDSLVNQTDFIELGTLLRMFEVDILDECIETIKNQTGVGIEHIGDEGLARIQESLHAKYNQTGDEMQVKL